MKRPSYRHAIAWVAENDSGGDEDCLVPVKVSELVSALLVADLFDVAPIRVGKDIVRYRKKRGFKGRSEDIYERQGRRALEISENCERWWAKRSQDQVRCLRRRHHKGEHVYDREYRRDPTGEHVLREHSDEWMRDGTREHLD